MSKANKEGITHTHTQTGGFRLPKSNIIHTQNTHTCIQRIEKLNSIHIEF